MPRTLRVASYNIHKAVGSDFRREPERIVQVLAEIGADLVALQEVDRRFGQREGVLDLDRIAEATGLAALRPATRLAQRADGWHGNLILARPAVAARAVTVDSLQLPGFEPRGALVADIRLGRRHFRVLSAHLGLLAGSRRQQVRALERYCAEHPVLFMGDTNEWRAGKQGSLARLVGALGANSQPQPVASFPARAPVLALDRIIAGRGLVLHHLARHDSALARRASDHLPLVAEVGLR